MPAKNRTAKGRRDPTPEIFIHFLMHGDKDTAAAAYPDHNPMELLIFTMWSNSHPVWREERHGILEAWQDEHPGTRPSGWWAFDAPSWRQDVPTRVARYGIPPDVRQPRRRLAGTGTPCHECLNYFPLHRRGVPAYWVGPGLVQAYVDLGDPLDSWVHAVDPGDLPVYESEASFLRRLGLLTPGEERRLGPEAFAPEILRIEVGPDDAVVGPA